jgi:hypothetical protein
VNLVITLGFALGSQRETMKRGPSRMRGDTQVSESGASWTTISFTCGSAETTLTQNRGKNLNSTYAIWRVSHSSQRQQPSERRCSLGSPVALRLRHEILDIFSLDLIRAHDLPRHLAAKHIGQCGLALFFRAWRY